MTINNANNVDIIAALNAAGSVQSAGTGTTSFNAPVVLTSSGADLTGNNFVFNDVLTTIGTAPVVIANSGLLTLASGSQMNLGGAFNQTGSGNVAMGGGIATNNADIVFSSPISLIDNAALSTGSGIGDIIFYSTINGSYDLFLDAGLGDVVFNSPVGGITPLG